MLHFLAPVLELLPPSICDFGVQCLPDLGAHLLLLLPFVFATCFFSESPIVSADLGATFWLLLPPALLASWPPGLLASWPPGLLASWPLPSCSLALLLSCPLAFLPSWPPGLLASWPPGFLASWHPAFPPSWPPGPLDSWLPGFLASPSGLLASCLPALLPSCPSCPPAFLPAALDPHPGPAECAKRLNTADPSAGSEPC